MATIHGTFFRFMFAFWASLRGKSKNLEVLYEPVPLGEHLLLAVVGEEVELRGEGVEVCLVQVEAALFFLQRAPNL